MPMQDMFYTFITRFPKSIIVIVLGLSIFFATYLEKLHWETDARVYMPKGHPAILYDEKIEEVFGVKNAIIIGIVNEDKGIYNAATLARIARITERVANLSGVVANRTIDVMSLSTASAFIGDETSIGAERLMATVPVGQDEIEQLKNMVYENRDLFIGNIVSEDGKAAVIRAKLKEGIDNRYQTYWEIKGILSQENGGKGEWGNKAGGESQDWQGNQWQKKDDQKWQGANAPNQASTEGDGAAASAVNNAEQDGDYFYLAGRPVIEVTAGMNALDDMKVMVPLLILTVIAVLFVIFRTVWGIILPLAIVGFAVIWTMGSMAILDIPMYTISTMLPIILVAVGIGNAVHLMGNYYDHVLLDPYRESGVIVKEVMKDLGSPLIMTSLTTAIGFLSLTFAEMPPFKIFGIFTVLGIVFCWLLSVTFIPATLVLLRPKVGAYLAKRRSIRVHAEEGWITRVLAQWIAFQTRQRRGVVLGIAITLVIVVFGASSLYVDSSWMSDFRNDSDVVKANNLLNERFDGAIFLNAVVEGKEPGALKSPEVLKKIEALQSHIEKLPYVGDSISIVDYLKSMNKNLHAGDKAYEVLPSSRQEIAEYLFLLSMSGRPDELNDVIDYDYRQANVTFLIKTDHTKILKSIIDETRSFVKAEFGDSDIDVNLAGSANNSYLWAQLLIDSQVISIALSKIGIFLIATLLFRSLIAGLLTVAPITFTTLFVAGMAGFMNIQLDVSTALAAGVAIGVGVDYAIHYLYRYRNELKKLNDHHEAILATTRSVGKTIVFNALVVTAGFLVLLGSQFPPHVKLGNFVAAYMVVSCAAALIIVPLLLSYRGARMNTGSK
ncbi:MAG TPA: MMPL family transporter [Gammaproteobacteria bacterium]